MLINHHHSILLKYLIFILHTLKGTSCYFRKTHTLPERLWFNPISSNNLVGGAVASWLVCSSPDRAVQVRALAGDIVLCSWARHLTLTVPLSTQVYIWVPANLMRGNPGGNPAMDWHPIQGGVEILLAA